MDENDIVTPGSESTPELAQIPDAKDYSAYKAERDGVKPEAALPAEAKPEELPKPAEKPPERRPYQVYATPDKAEIAMRATSARLAEIEAKLNGGPAKTAEPERIKEPDPQDFVGEDGKFDSKGYTKAIAEFSRQEAREAYRQEREQEKQQERQQQEARRVEETVNTWRTEAQKIADADPEIEKSLLWIGSEEVTRTVPRENVVELTRAHPLVAHAIASSQELFDVYAGSDSREAARMIAILDYRVRHELSQAQAGQSSPPAAPQQPLRVPDRSETPRQGNGQFVAKGARDVDAGASSGTNSNSYERFREEMNRKLGRR